MVSLTKSEQSLKRARRWADYSHLLLTLRPAPPRTHQMFEHMKNYKTLLSRVASWLAPGGRLFVHIFVHKAGLPCHYEVRPVVVTMRPVSHKHYAPEPARAAASQIRACFSRLT